MNNLWNSLDTQYANGCAIFQMRNLLATVTEVKNIKTIFRLLFKV